MNTEKSFSDCTCGQADRCKSINDGFVYVITSCPKCKNTFRVTISISPYTAICPHCHENVEFKKPCTKLLIKLPHVMQSEIDMPKHLYGFMIEVPVPPHLIPVEVLAGDIPPNAPYFKNVDGVLVSNLEVKLLANNFFDAVENFIKLYGTKLNIVSTGKFQS